VIKNIAKENNSAILNTGIPVLSKGGDKYQTATGIAYQPRSDQLRTYCNKQIVREIAVQLEQDILWGPWNMC
jgi:hypothetical protein